MEKLEITERKGTRVILLFFLLIVIFFVCYNYNNNKQEYQKEINKELKGIVTKKYRIQKNNPKSMNIKINDSDVFRLPFSLTMEIQEGDTLIKNSGDSFYFFKTPSKKIKYVFPKASFLGYPEGWRGLVEITHR